MFGSIHVSIGESGLFRHDQRLTMRSPARAHARMCRDGVGHLSAIDLTSHVLKSNFRQSPCAADHTATLRLDGIFSNVLGSRSATDFAFHFPFFMGQSDRVMASAAW
ncbi:hypothetical protein BTW08_07625 [Salinicola sp. MH3R3-1]|nr:hypothetical protein BTW08_07625 [Salinicola sp. MH3R3-1]